MSVMQAFDLTGKTAVVTGVNGGLGEAFSHALDEAGAAVAIAARRVDRAQAVANAITANGGRAAAFEAGIAEP